MSESIEIHGLDELIARMRAFPTQLKESMEATMQAALLVLWENVPPYPPPPGTSTYVRTGTLGRTLGSGEGGGKASGTPDVYEVRELGGGYVGRFGTNLEYGPYVIGDTEQARHMQHWWKIGSIAGKSEEEIRSLFNVLAEKLAQFLEGKGA